MRAVKNIARPLCLIVIALACVAGRLQAQEAPSKIPIEVTVSDLSSHPEAFDGRLVRIQALLVFGWEGDNFLLDPSKPKPLGMHSRDPASIWVYCKPEHEPQVYGPIGHQRVVYGAFDGYFHFLRETHVVNGVFEPGPLQFEAVEVSIPEPQPHSLAEATILGDVDETRRIIGSDVQIRDKYSNILLFLATQTGRVDFAQELLATGADPKFTAPGGDTSLMKAAWNCDVEIAKVLLSHDAYVNAANVNGETALIFASQTCSDGKMVQVLLNAGADPNAKAKGGSTALMAAVRNPIVAEKLLKAGADPAAKSEYGNTAESESCDRGAEGFYRVCQLVRKALGKSPCEPGSCN